MVPPAWYRACVPEWRKVGTWQQRDGAIVWRACNCFRHEESPFAKTLLDRYESDIAVRSFLDSKFRWVPPDLEPEPNPLLLTPNDLARYYPPPDLEEDVDVYYCQSFYQGMCNRFETAFLPGLTKDAVMAGAAKIMRHPATLILIAAPHLLVEEEDLPLDTHIDLDDMGAWFSVPGLRLALFYALDLRKKGHSALPPGWYSVGGEPFTPPTGTQPYEAQLA